MNMNNYMLPRNGWEFLDNQTRDELMHDDYEDPPPPQLTDEERAVEELNSFLRHYGFEEVGPRDRIEDVAELLARLLGHIETTVTTPAQTRTVRVRHELYPERDK